MFQSLRLRARCLVSISDSSGDFSGRAPSGLIALVKADSSFQHYGTLKDIFLDRIYFSISRFLDGNDSERLRAARDLEKKWEIPLVATNEVHYHVQERRSPQAMAQLFRDFRRSDSSNDRNR
jgi:error-prone DNA polymerase